MAARELAEESLAWMEQYSDSSCHLLRYPGSRGFYSNRDITGESCHLVRESVWWAIGLLLRNQGTDAARGQLILEEVLRWQFDDPTASYHGSFHSAPEVKLPPGQDAQMWKDYDPNWRQFIGTCFLIILEKLSDRLSPDLESRLKGSIRLSVEGETPGRIVPEYSNIAMMQAALLVNAGRILNESVWQKEGLQLAEEIYRLFSHYESFAEYNSPTYYGIILYALRLWRFETSHPQLQEQGSRMESALWQHVARFYHPGLRNICGPFDRAYGMDMTKYVSGIGIWLRMELGLAKAPLPSLAGKFDHAHDLVLAPVAALLGMEIPAQSRQDLREFRREREIRHVIASKPALRIATACLKSDRMWGGESGSTAQFSRSQFHPATAHWVQPDGTIAWLRLENTLAVDASATLEGLSVHSSAEVYPAQLSWRLSAGTNCIAGEDKWQFAGMTIYLTTNLPPPSSAIAEDGTQVLTYVVSAGQKASFSLKFSSRYSG